MPGSFHQAQAQAQQHQERDRTPARSSLVELEPDSNLSKNLKAMLFGYQAQGLGILQGVDSRKKVRSGCKQKHTAMRLNMSVGREG